MKTEKQVIIPIRLQDHDLDGHFSRLVGVARKDWPIRFGVPFPEGQLRDIKQLELQDGKRALPFQCQITNRWKGGSIRRKGSGNVL